MERTEQGNGSCKQSRFGLQKSLVGRWRKERVRARRRFFESISCLESRGTKGGCPPQDITPGKYRRFSRGISVHAVNYEAANVLEETTFQ
jgi:hypothetical protein